MAILSKLKNTPCWDKLHVIEGDSCLSRFALDMVMVELKNPIRVRLGTEDTSKIRQTLTAFSIFDQAPAFILTEPTADTGAKLLEIIEAGRVTASAIVVMAGETGLDGRTALAKAAKKNKRVMRLEPILADDTRGLMDHLKGWQQESKIIFDPGGIKYLRANRPVRPIKGARGNDAQAIDLESLESELTKLIAISRANGGVTPIGLIEEVCDFDTAPLDVWSFVSAGVSGETQRALSILDDMSVSKDNLGPLWLLLSQLEFLISLASVRASVRTGVSEEGSPEIIAAQMSENLYSGRFTLENGEIAEKITKTKVVNSWRVRKAMEEGIPNIERLVNSYKSVVNAIRDIRSDIPVNMVTLILTLALSGSCRYNTPFSDPQESSNQLVL